MFRIRRTSFFLLTGMMLITFPLISLFQGDDADVCLSIGIPTGLIFILIGVHFWRKDFPHV